MVATCRQPLDFEHLRRLAERDPAGFEAQRKQLIDAAIVNAPAPCRDRLERLQWRVDQVRDRSATPLAACIRISQMMWDSVTGDRGLLSALRGNRKALPKQGAKVLGFPVRDSARK